MSHGRPEGVPVRDVIATAVLMSVVTLATVSPTLNQQFNVLINVSVVLYMAIYAYCCVALVRLSGALPRTARLAAIAWALIAFAFCVWVVSASDLALVIPAAVILALTVLVWPVVRLRGRPTTEPPVAA
jgi:arginine:agmatine antiporter